MEKEKNKTSYDSDEMDASIRAFLRNVASVIVPTKAKIKQVSDCLGLSESTVEQMRIYGKGSVVSWLKLIMYKYDLSAKDVNEFFENYSVVATAQETPSPTDKLYHEVKQRFSDDEIFVWLRLLLAKQEIEASLSPKKNSRKK